MSENIYKYDGTDNFPYKIRSHDGYIFSKVNDGIYENAFIPEYMNEKGDLCVITDVEKYDVLEEFKTILIDNEKYRLKVASYFSDPLVLGISIINNETEELYDTITTNLGTNNGNNAVMGKGKSCVDENRKDLIDIIKSNHLGRVDMRFGEPSRNYSGFNSYLIFEFDLNVLSNYDKNGVKEYLKGYDKNFEKELEKFKRETFGYSTSDFFESMEEDEEIFSVTEIKLDEEEEI